MNDFLDFVRDVKRANDIVDVIGSYIELKKRGANYWARCPFHGERTPSFTVTQSLQIYKCFGCGESGDVVKFVQKYESCSFTEAVEILAKRANMKMPETLSRRNDAEFEEKKKHRDLHFAIAKDAAVFYWRCFYSEKGTAARNYMSGRNFSADTLKTFGIGFSPDMYSLPEYLSKKYSAEECKAAGVLQQTKSGRYFDALCGRLIIPVFDINGRVIAFGGRALDEKTVQYGKYKNTSDTDLFQKRFNLFALNLAKKEKQRAALPYIVVVEGYMDVISMYQAGFCKAVASMGTSLTVQQAKLIGRLTDTVYICYDGDLAGQKATVRGMDVLKGEGLDVKVVSVPDKLDPDEYIKKFGAEKFESLLGQALSLADYKLELLNKSFDIGSSSPAVRNDALPKYVKGALKMLAEMDDESREHYINVVSAKTGYSEDYFRRKLSGAAREDAAFVISSSGDRDPYYFLAAALLRNLPFAKLDEMPVCDETVPDKAFRYVGECVSRGVSPEFDMIYTLCPNAPEEQFAKLCSYEFTREKEQTDKAYFDDCVKNLSLDKLARRKEEILTQLKNVENDDEYTILCEKIQEIDKSLDELKRE